MNNNDTIVAISSTVGLAARIIVRASGADAMRMVRALADDPLMIAPSQVVNARLNLGNGLRFAAGVFAFFGPHSATGEDVVEFHIPGNALLARRLLDELIARGARQADAGEFTARAFFNGKLDLAEAEGVAATVSASSQADLDAARRLMAGALAKRVEPLIESVAETLALTEVGIDFSEEAVSFLARDDALTHIGSAIDSVRRLLDESPRMERLSHEPAIVLSGKPNAGKSTLLNALAGRERAITSHVAGTTRDALSARVKLPRGFVRVIDVAGVDTNESGGASAIDIQMRDTAMLAIENADLLIHVIDSSEPALTSRPTGILPVDSAIDRRDARETMKSAMLTSRVPDLVVHTKADLSNETSDRFVVSAQTGEAMDELRDRLDALAFGTSSCSSSALALNARHVRALSEARDALVRARDVIDAGPELIAVELREALDALGSVLGRVTPDDVLTRVFAAFCIGK